MGADDVLQQLGQIELDVDLVTRRAQTVEASLGDLFGDQDACHRPIIVTGPEPRSKVH
jgi:hypothetical protein